MTPRRTRITRAGAGKVAAQYIAAGKPEYAMRAFLAALRPPSPTKTRAVETFAAFDSLGLDSVTFVNPSTFAPLSVEDAMALCKSLASVSGWELGSALRIPHGVAIDLRRSIVVSRDGATVTMKRKPTPTP